MAAQYQIKRSADGRQYMWNLKGDNHEIILTSEHYIDKSGAQKGIASAQANSPHDQRYQRNGNTFNLKAGNGEIIGRSEEYSSSGAMETGILACKRYGPTAPIVDLS